MIVDKLFRGKSVGVVALVASIGFVVGSVYMYRIPLDTVFGQLFTILVLLAIVVLIALLLAGLLVWLKKLLDRDD